MEAEMRTGDSIEVSSAPSSVGPESSHNRPPTGTETQQRDLFALARRQRLPDERASVTHKFSVGGSEGYITVGMYSDGRPGEVFIKMSKEGSTLSGFMDGVAVSISIGLQYGVPLKILVDKLTNTRFEPSGFTENPSIRYASSILDYIARWLGGKFLSPEYLKPRTAPAEHELGQPAMAASSVNANERGPGHQANGSTKVRADAPSCANCGMLMVPNGSCYECVNCGSTSGCS